MNRESTQVILVRRPEGLPTGEDFELRTAEVGEPAAGEVVVENRFISLDPAMRGWMREGRSYIPPVGLGEVMRAGAVGEVVASADPKFSVGDHVYGVTGVQSVARTAAKGLTKVDPKLAPLSAYLGILGMPGMTAYFGLLEVGAMKAGDTVVVSGAAGAVGSVVGQIAKLQGAKTVVGIAGGPDKCTHLIDDLGFDVAIDYKNEDVRARLAEACPDGLDVYFDNVGGEILDTALGRLARGARVVICGAISQYNQADKMRGPANYMALLVSRARMEGFVVFDYVARYPEAYAKLGPWLAEGKLRYRETVIDGLENFSESFAKLFSGEKLGKLVLKVG
ncbi:NADP-dependent oxidoreductase [Pseudenhygromyxa sp. WMMC2535]|uniref:NADP-dependent oxidoreductase n=1 Tax=Pseudenhygromyxa sp. WMMC2535 TaxID=2712867 RepID=UPI0015582BC3|nr:NADP-dependent oxidoreductase [Pseudenhygromyxa sp. WMMC2535]NVB36854.1 NADP-dependent oxidoreductase [Pseudenhygromyxa sp. WMMC2535]